MAADDRKPDLSAFQLEVARLFFALPASQGFLLAGGAAVMAETIEQRGGRHDSADPPTEPYVAGL
jgi:hypothetical protein